MVGMVLGLGWRADRPVEAGSPSAPLTAPTTCGNQVRDPGFEDLFSPWSQSYANYSPIDNLFPPPFPLWDCPDGTCEVGPNGPAGPRSGVNWAWFGGGITNTTTSPVTQNVSQSINLSAGTATLEFYLWVSRADAGVTGNDHIRALIDATPVFTVTATSAGAYTSGYAPVTLDLTPFANGLAHTLSFSATTQAASTSPKPIISFNVDDVSVCVTTKTYLPIITK